MATNSGRREPKAANAEREPIEDDDFGKADSVKQGDERFGDSEGASGIDPQEIAALAYRYWEERGRPESSPEQDWFRAEETLRREWKKSNGS